MEALIDMDLVCYRSAASAEKDDVGIAIYRMNELFDNILVKTKATSYRAFLSSSNNFRKEIDPEYKANRTAPKPRHLQACREYAVDQMNAEIAPDGLEADDMLGICQTDDTVICSLDKDLLQVEGKHFQWAIAGKNWERPDEFIDQHKNDGLRLFYQQCITGDPSDNVKGIKGMGKARAKKELGQLYNEEDMFNKVRRLYNNDEEFLKNARCLWIKRSLEDDFEDRFDAYI